MLVRWTRTNPEVCFSQVDDVMFSVCECTTIDTSVRAICEVCGGVCVCVLLLGEKLYS